jgi:eukaryotic-like serine/threonine-protein kinase
MSEDMELYLEDFEIIKKIGEGGMGKVYLGHEKKDNLRTPKAIKVISPDLVKIDKVRARFQREGRIQNRVGQHQNIVQVYGMYEEDDKLFIVMEYVEGRDVDDILDQDGLLPADIALPLFRQALEAISHSHNKGVLHRDIKPSNILVVNPNSGMPSENDHVKVMDFGIARLKESDRLTQVTIDVEGRKLMTPGTPEYMAPELLASPEDLDQGPQDANEISDIYSLGVTLYQMVTNNLPYPMRGNDVVTALADLINQHKVGDPLPAREHYEFLDDGVNDVIMKAINVNPDDRYRSVDEFIADIDRLNSGKSTGGSLSNDNDHDSGAIESIVPVWLGGVTWAAILGLGFIIGSLLVG